MNKKDKQIVEQLINGNHLNDSELKRAEQIVEWLDYELRHNRLFNKMQDHEA